MATIAAGERQMSGVHGVWPARLALALLVVAIALLAVKAVGIARYDAAILRFPFQVDDAEGVILAEARLIGAGTNPYAFQPSPSSHFYAGPYPPVYTLLNTAGMALFGPTFKFGRLVQLVATLVVGGWIAWAVARTGSGRRAWLFGAWAAGLFLSAHLVAVWSVRVRPDMTALAANLAGVTLLRAWWAERGSGFAVQSSGRIPRTANPKPRTRLAAAWPQGSEWTSLLGGAACFALAWWTKQTFIAVPIAFVLVLLFHNPRVAITFAALYGAFILVPFGLLTIVTRGGFFQKTVTYQGSWEWAAFRRLAQPFAERYSWLLVLALAAAVIVTIRARQLTFGVAWFALALVIAFGAGTSGGNHNHFVELLAASAFLVGQGAVAACDFGWRAPRARTWAAVGVACVALLMVGVSAAEHEGKYGWLAREIRQPSASDRAGFEAVASYIANHPGPVYSTDVGILVVTDQVVRVTDPFTMAAEVRLGRWDDRDLVADLDAGRYGLIVTNYDIATVNPDQPPTDATPGVIRAIQTRYHLVAKNVRYLYESNEGGSRG
jgi:hypothetical protein